MKMWENFFKKINKPVPVFAQTTKMEKENSSEDSSSSKPKTTFCDVAGVDAIIALKGCVDIYNPKVIRSTMGSIFDMNVIHATQEEALRILKLKKFDIVSSYLDTNNYYNTVEYNYKTALVIGNEANGINEELVSKSDVLVKIPIYGKAESLNAAISSAILMYEIKKYLV